MKLTLDTPVKFLTAAGRAPYQDTKWNLPCAGGPAYPMRTYKSQPVMCERGWHYTTLRHWRAWASARCFIIEPSGTIIGPQSDGKYVAQGARLLRELTYWGSVHRYLYETALLKLAKRKGIKLPASFISERFYYTADASKYLSGYNCLPGRHASPIDFAYTTARMLSYINLRKFNYDEAMLSYLQEEFPDDQV